MKFSLQLGKARCAVLEAMGVSPSHENSKVCIYPHTKEAWFVHWHIDKGCRILEGSKTANKAREEIYRNNEKYL
jgi:hypothetical protein